MWKDKSFFIFTTLAEITTSYTVLLPGALPGVTEYMVSLMSTGGAIQTSQTVAADTSNVIFTGLQPGREYSYQIIAKGGQLTFEPVTFTLPGEHLCFVHV